MDDKTQKERLEQELRFLKESFEAEVISKEEFEKGSDRIERKLREIRASEPEKKEVQKGAPKSEEKKEPGEEKIKLNVISDDKPAEKTAEKIEKKPIVEKKYEAPVESGPEVKKSRLWIYLVVILIIAGALFFYFRTPSAAPGITCS